MVNTIDIAATSLLDAIEIAAEEVKFDENKIKRASDGKFAKKNGSTEPATAEPAKSDLALIDRLKEKFPAGGELLQAIADRGKDPAIEGAVKQVMSAYDGAVKAPDNAMRAIGASCVAAQKSIDSFKDYAFTVKDFPSEDNSKAAERQTQLIRDLKKNVSRAVAAISSLLDPEQIALKMSEANKWLKTKASNTLEGASKFLDGLMKSAGENIPKMEPPKAAPVPAVVTTPAPAKLAKAQIKSVVEFSNAVGEGFAAAARSELAVGAANFANEQTQKVGKAAIDYVNGRMEAWSKIDPKANLDSAGKKIKEDAAQIAGEASILADKMLVSINFGKSSLSGLESPIPAAVRPRGGTTSVKAPPTIEQAKTDLKDYSGRVGRAIYGVLTAKVAETVGKIPQKLTEEKKPDLRPTGATQLDNIKKKLGLEYNTTKARTPLGQLGRNIENSFKQKGLEIARSIENYQKDVDRNKPLIRQDLGIPSVRDLVMTDDINAVLNFKDRAEQLLKGVVKTSNDNLSEADRADDLHALKLEGMRRMQNLQQLMVESMRQSALDYQAAAQQRLEAKAAAAQAN